MNLKELKTITRSRAKLFVGLFVFYCAIAFISTSFTKKHYVNWIMFEVAEYVDKDGKIQVVDELKSFRKKFNIEHNFKIGSRVVSKNIFSISKLGVWDFQEEKQFDQAYNYVLQHFKKRERIIQEAYGKEKVNWVSRTKQLNQNLEESPQYSKKKIAVRLGAFIISFLLLIFGIVFWDAQKETNYKSF